MLNKRVAAEELLQFDEVIVATGVNPRWYVRVGFGARSHVPGILFLV
jgi:hypothetical protein